MPPFSPTISGAITRPKGFKAAGVFCGIKERGTGKATRGGGKLDLAVITSVVPANAAGMFTTNQVRAAPVKWCLEQIQRGKAQAIVANSGNANACTGERGWRDVETMASLTANELGLDPPDVLVASTGRIGVPLPMARVRRGIKTGCESLSKGRDAAHRVARALMTSDTRPKELAVEFEIGGRPVRIGGVAKGAGMIHPGMSPTGLAPASLPHATMLAFLTTDVRIGAGPLKNALTKAVAQSFNRITVDGDRSTNDTVLILANGEASNHTLRAGSPEFERFQAALDHVSLELAKMIVLDGEGATRLVAVRVHGARTAAEADAAARSVANSVLVKTSWNGGDPNWGRILDALGYAPARVVAAKTDVAYSAPGSPKRLYALRAGEPTRVRFQRLCQAVAPAEFDLHIDLNLGRGEARIYASDLTEAYVDFNKGDISDPGSPCG